MCQARRAKEGNGRCGGRTLVRFGLCQPWLGPQGPDLSKTLSLEAEVKLGEGSRPRQVGTDSLVRQGMGGNKGKPPGMEVLYWVWTAPGGGVPGRGNSMAETWKRERGTKNRVSWPPGVVLWVEPRV